MRTIVTDLTHHKHTEKEDKKKRFLSLYMTIILIALLWMVKIADILFELRLNQFGIKPREIEGLFGIVTTGLLHGDFVHLISNSIALLVVMPVLYYFYRPVALKVLLAGYLITGILTWTIAGGGNHIGASGLVYMIFGFLLVSGFIRRHYRLMAVGLMMLILHSTFSGSLLMKFIPELNAPTISWEGHLSGFISGILLAIVYRREGPQKPTYHWEEDEEEDEEDTHDDKHHKPSHPPVRIIYQYKEPDNTGSSNN